MTSKVLCGINQLRHLISHQRKVCKSHKALSLCVCVCESDFLVFNPATALTGSATLWSIDSPNPTSVFKPPSPATILILHAFLISPTCGPHTGTRVVFRVTPTSSPHSRDPAGFCSPPGHPLQTFAWICRGNACRF